MPNRCDLKKDLVIPMGWSVPLPRAQGIFPCPVSTKLLLLLHWGLLMAAEEPLRQALVALGVIH